jgi:5-(carboxyamino)imidazole ribonucleotide mutase
LTVLLTYGKIKEKLNRRFLQLTDPWSPQGSKKPESCRPSGQSFPSQDGTAFLLFLRRKEGSAMKKVAVIMGSDSDLPVVQGAISQLKKFNVPFEAHVISAHRTPAAAEQFAKNAADNGFGVIIAAAGKAAHLGGVLAAYTTLPVIGLPIKTSMMGGLDSLLSIVQMPKGIPVATVGVDAADNAGILAVQMLALSEPSLAAALAEYKQTMADEVAAKDVKLQQEV